MDAKTLSFYNTINYSQKHSAANLAYGGQWQWPANYHHTPTNSQYLGEMDSPHSQVYYNPHAMFHSSAGAPPEWHPPTSVSAADGYGHHSSNTNSAHQTLQSHHLNSGSGGALGTLSGPGHTSVPNGSVSAGSSSTTSGTPAVPSSRNAQLSESGNGPLTDPHMADGMPSPTITVSGSEISSPDAPAASSSPHHASALHINNRNRSPGSNSSAVNSNSSNQSSPTKPQYYEWMRKPAYPAQPAPGKTRTKDKYRVVYTDYQRLELEKEYCTSRYITIRRKTELAQMLTLSERQVKIWFQNRRAKERKQNKKTNDPSVPIMGGGVQHGDYVNMMDAKPKLEPGLHLPHSLHSMSSMAAMGVPNMGLHHLHSHHSLAMSAAHQHQLHHQNHAHVPVSGGVHTM